MPQRTYTAKIERRFYRYIITSCCKLWTHFTQSIIPYGNKIFKKKETKRKAKLNRNKTKYEQKIPTKTINTSQHIHKPLTKYNRIFKIDETSLYMKEFAPFSKSPISLKIISIYIFPFKQPCIILSDHIYRNNCSI